MEMLEVELTGKQLLVFEACCKIQLGKKMFEEGTLELSNLVGDNPKSSKKIKPSKKGKTIASLKTFSTFRKDKPDQNISERILGIVRVNKQASTELLKRKLHCSDRRLIRIIDGLKKEGKIESNGKGGNQTAWVPIRKVAKMTNGVNGHGVKLTGGRGGAIDVTDQSLVDKTIKFLETHDWVTKGMLIENVDLSVKPMNRLLNHLKEKKIVKEVQKKHNPFHKQPKNFERMNSYWEMA